MIAVGDILKTLEDGWTRIKYDSNKIYYSNDSWINYGDMKYSTAANASYKFYVKGTSFRIIGYKNNDRGDISVSIDGEVKTYNAYNSSLLTDALLFEERNLDKKIHVVEVKKVSGTYIDIMGIDINDDSELVSDKDYIDDLINITPLMTSNAFPPPYVASASSEYTYPGQPTTRAYQAFCEKEDLISEWYGWSSEYNVAISESSPQWLMIDFGSPICCTVFSIQARDASTYTLPPKDFKIQGSEDGLEFDDIVTVINQEFKQNEMKMFPSKNKKAYRFYRLYITKVTEYSTNGRHVFIRNFKLYQQKSLLTINALTFHKTLRDNLPESIKSGENQIHFTEDGGIFINDKEGNLKQCNTGEIVKEISNPLTTSDMSEESPVGNIISVASTRVPPHYLVCDGSEYNVSDYPYLVEHFKENLGSIDCFGGDGINTFAVPNIEKNLLSVTDHVPTMSSNTSSNLVKITSSGSYSGSYEYYAFDNNSSTGWFANTNPESSTNYAWIQCQFLDEAKKINTVQLRNYSYGGHCRCKDFVIQGSNDGVIYNDLVTDALPNNANQYSIFEINDQQKYSYIRIKTISNYGPSGIYNFGLGDIKIQFAVPSVSCIKYEPIHFAVNQYGGFETQVLFDGKASASGANYTLSDAIDNYNYIYVKADVTNASNKTCLYTSLIIMKDDFVLGDIDSYILNIANTDAGRRYVVFGFKDVNNLTIGNIVKYTGDISCGISKIIGIKGQLPSLLCGGEF